MKRFFATALALVMVLCCVPIVKTEVKAVSGTKQYTVLVLDTSSATTFTSNGNDIYRADTAIEYVQMASCRFLDSISKASGENYIAVVSYKDTATTVSGFTQDFSYLKREINSLYASGSESIADGLETAGSLLDEIGDENAFKNVVLFTTGMTSAGDYSYSGRYDGNTIGSSWKKTSTGVKIYAYANAAWEQARILKEKNVGVYTIGLFQTMEGMPEKGQSIAAFFRLLTSDLATSGDYYYPVDDPEHLEFTFGAVAENIINPLMELTFTYQSGGDHTATCYYTNEYFSGSSYMYKPGLATMSVSFAMSAFGSGKGGKSDYSNKSANARQLLMDIGFREEDIGVNDWFTQKPTTDSIGVIVGNKPITVQGENFTLIAVAVRGRGYEAEWASNFTIGKEGQHSGFDAAKNHVIEYLRTYVEERNITGPVKLWITGFSRAAATANLVGGEIDNGAVISSSITYDLDDVYTYCFETPAGALAEQVNGREKYNNIFNIINSSDPVPYVAPAAMGFARYGVDRFLPSKESDPIHYGELKDDMLDIYEGLDSTSEYIVDDFQMKKIQIKNWLPLGEKISVDIQNDTKNPYSQGMFLTNYVTILADEFLVNRDNYVCVYQDEIREICSILFGCTSEQSDKMKDSLISQAKEGWKDLAWTYFWYSGNPWKTEDDALQIISNWLKKAVEDAGVTDYDEATIDAAGKDLADLLLALGSNHPNYAATAWANIDGLKAAHSPELCYAWLASMDDNYVEGAVEAFNQGGYRIVRINCAVDVTVTDEYGNVVASITGEQPNVDGSYVYGVDEDGQKYVVLPVDSDYSVAVVAREDGLVNYSVSEYCAQTGGYTRSVNYFDVELKQGETLMGAIPAYSDAEVAGDTPDGSKVQYALVGPDLQPVFCDSDKSGASAQEDVFYVTALPSNEVRGMAFGSGVHSYGTFAKVEAAAFEGYQFEGWYRNGVLVSDEAEYRVRVTEDVELIAGFICLHSSTEIRDAAEAAYFSDGYTGDTYCVNCEEKLEDGQEVPAGYKEDHLIFWLALFFIVSGGIAAVVVTVIVLKRKRAK